MLRAACNISSAGLPVADGVAALATVSTSAAASTPLSLGTINVSRFSGMSVLFTASSALTGGVCDYVLQRLMGNNAYDDYVYLGQQAAGVAFNKHCWLPIVSIGPTTEAAVGVLTDWTPHDTLTDATIALAAGAGRNGLPGTLLRVVSRTGAGVSVAAVTNTYVRAFY